ncbi:MAG: 5-oxoprolinase subunit PxpB [Bacteroidetes bacterium]|nr:5-oxoprolinase subunit PxpB [Bacteroidota bacterium]
MTNLYTITPLNETAVLVSFGNVIEEEINRKVISLHRKLIQEPFEGFIESVPAYSSLAIFYDSIKIKSLAHSHQTSFYFVKGFLEKILEESISVGSEKSRSVLELPVLYDGDDLDFVAQQHQLFRDEVIVLHTSKTYRVFMIGFLPGFSYMGTVDERIVTPRKNSPRTNVPAGSVGIAGMQTGIYPQASPGGWQLIGRTPLKIFDVKKKSPCLFSAGDSVKFYSIDKTEFEKLNEY